MVFFFDLSLDIIKINECLKNSLNHKQSRSIELNICIDLRIVINDKDKSLIKRNDHFKSQLK